MIAPAAIAPSEAWHPAPMPAALAAMDDDRRMTFDVRDELARGIAPFGRIIAAANELPPGHALVLRTPFEPIPLYRVLGRRGFAHWTERQAPDDWRAWFWQDGAPAPPAGAGTTYVLDVRGLASPPPMGRVLERLASLGTDETLAVLHDCRPLFLYPQLEARGFTHETDEPANGLVRIRIRRQGAAP
jgi:uncharacterized protein (DUF2249 family)